MSQFEIVDNDVTASTEKAASAYVPPLQRTAGQPPPIAANGGLSYMSFDRDGDAGTAAALEDALAQIAEGEGQRVTEMIDSVPPGAPVRTKWGVGFRKYEECVDSSAGTTPTGPGRRPGGAAALYGLRTADLLRRAIQRRLAGSGARRGGADPAPE